MESQEVTIPWGDGSGEEITLTFSENSEGVIEVNIQSPQLSVTGNNRSRILRVLSDSSRSIDIELDQTNVGIGSMEVGINFIVR